MTAAPASSSTINAPSRCTQTFANHKRCRLPATPDSAFCTQHARRESDDLAAALTDGLDQFTFAAPINQFLSRLLLLLAQDRISPRRGAVMAYTANLLLRSITVMDREASAEQTSDNRPVQFIWDIPRPGYTKPPVEVQIPQPAGETPPGKISGSRS